MLSRNIASDHRELPDMQPGLRPNLGQFSLLATITFGVGLVVGAERVVVPVLAKQDFGVASFLATLSFIISFGFAQAAAGAGMGHRAACAIYDYLRAVLGMGGGGQRPAGHESGAGLDHDGDGQD